MAEPAPLVVELHGRPIGTITLLQGDRSIFAFEQAYVDDAGRPTLSLSFKDASGGLVTDVRATRVRLPAFFSNLLPEGPMRTLLARRAGVHPRREFMLLRTLGHDLPGALRIRSSDDGGTSEVSDHPGDDAPAGTAEQPLRFSLAGVQLKFSAVQSAGSGLTIPADGAGGSWIVKLPSATYQGVPENEFSMMTLARLVGIDVPEIRLVAPEEIIGLPQGIGIPSGPALAVRRFDRGPDGPVHIEDFAQVFGIFPELKYERAGYRNIAEVIRLETDEGSRSEFIRRLVFNTLIGNGDMHLKNWSLIYRDRRRATIAPGYDFVSTIPYIPGDRSALSYGRTKRMEKFGTDELAYLAAKAGLPERSVLRTARETVARFREVWSREAAHLPLPHSTVEAIGGHLARVPIAAG